MNRRTFLSVMGALPAVAAAQAPTAPVSVERCRSYGAEIVPALDRMFDRLGGLGKLVKGKTVAIKLNLISGPTRRLGHMPLGESHWPHPNLIGATMHLMARAGAHRIRLLECCWSSRPIPLEESLIEANWDLDVFTSAAPRVEFENTNWLGSGKRYSRLTVPGGGLVFPAYDLNHSYEDCDVFVSFAKFKEHSLTGVTLGMKNLFGMTPLSVYGSSSSADEPNEISFGNRMPILHMGQRQPPRSSPGEVDPTSPRDDNYRLPRIIVDLVRARPVHLTVLDGIMTLAGGQSPNHGHEPVSPGILAAGNNVATTSAVAMALMNYDPMAGRGDSPFGPCDSKLQIAEQAGVGTRDLRRIEVVGTPIAEARFDFRALRERREARKPDA